MVNRKDLGKIGEYFTDKDNVLIKRQLLANIHKSTTGANEMSEERLDKATKAVAYTLQLYNMSDDMNRKLKKLP